MFTDPKKVGSEEQDLPKVETGNASNPSPRDPLERTDSNQLIDERGEKYLREVASPEDYPDAEDEEQAES